MPVADAVNLQQQACAAAHRSRRARMRRRSPACSCCGTSAAIVVADLVARRGQVHATPVSFQQQGGQVVIIGETVSQSRCVRGAGGQQDTAALRTAEGDGRAKRRWRASPLPRSGAHATGEGEAAARRTVDPCGACPCWVLLPVQGRAVRRLDQTEPLLRRRARAPCPSRCPESAWGARLCFAGKLRG